jgi:HEPN domain-containing protein/predicted nucleotidyltransferase
LRELVEALQSYAPEKILLFGSYARGEQDDFSDLDIVVIKETEERFLDRLARICELVPEAGAMDVLVYTPDEFAGMQAQGRVFIQQVVEDGVVLYERSTGMLPWHRPQRLDGRGWGMARREEEARSWLEQARADLQAAIWLLEGEHYYAVCFWAQQAAEKALKAFIYLQGQRHIVEHSIYRLCQICADQEAAFTDLVAVLSPLDRFYITTRYPNSLPLGAVPARTYRLGDAQDALALAKQALQAVEAFFVPVQGAEPGTNDTDSKSRNREARRGGN